MLIGPAGAGKSTWAAANFEPSQIVSSDALRAAVGESEHDQAASSDAFAVLEDIVRRRLRRRLTTVIDSTGLDAPSRASWRAMARDVGVPAVAVVVTAPPAEVRRSNRNRARVVPDQVVSAQLRTFEEVRSTIEHEGFDLVITADRPARVVPKPIFHATAPSATPIPEPVGDSLGPTGLRFGLQVQHFGGPGGPAGLADRLADIARAAEAAGFTSLWVMDHFRQIPQVGPAWADLPEAYTALGYLAGVTSTIRLGTLVTGVTYRNIGLVAKAVATLDVLSGGRANCGIGAAWFRQEHEAYGYRFPPARERLDLLEDALQVLPLFWGKGTPSFEGKAISIPEAMCYPRPLQERIPILVGGSGERRTLRLVARYADACNLFGDVASVERKLAVLHRHCAAVGRDPATVEVTHLATTLVGRDHAEVDRLVGALKPKRQSAERFAASVNAGTVDEQVARFRSLATAGVQTAIVSLADLTDSEPVERFAAVIDAFR